MAGNEEPCCRPMFWVYLLICVCLVLFAGLMSGLTLGLMSLSLVDLEVLAKAGRPQDRKNAGTFLSCLLPHFSSLAVVCISHIFFMFFLSCFQFLLRQLRFYQWSRTSICSCAPCSLGMLWQWRYLWEFSLGCWIFFFEF